ncbi:hypothetical protein C8R44DRAFT_882721 [Mycena epipterygia]|nr:hypothetical protein C8R44DRAFT_882721 [Mycena epipterygia]
MPYNNLAIQFSVLSFSLLEHSARGIASHLEVFAICVTARFYLSHLILCSITAFWRNTLGKRAWVTPVTGKEWSVNIKVWVNVLGGHSTVQYVYSYVASPGLCSPHRHSVSVLPSIPFIYLQPTTRRNRPPLHALSRHGRDERHPSHVTRPTNPLSEFAISLAD